MSDSPLSSKLRLGVLAFAATAVGVGALVLAPTGTAGDEECNGKPADVVVNGPEPYRGDKTGEVIVGDGEQNEIHGHGGNDTICGGDGEDHLAGGEGNDKIFGEDNDDRLFGRPGNDRLDGGRENSDDKAGKGKFNGDGCYGGIPNPSDPTTDPDISTDCEDERGVRVNEQQEN